MTRINTLSLLATSKEPPPLSVWRMTMLFIGAAFGAASSQPTARLKTGSRRLTR